MGGSPATDAVTCNCVPDKDNTVSKKLTIIDIAQVVSIITILLWTSYQIAEMYYPDEAVMNGTPIEERNYP